MKMVQNSAQIIPEDLYNLTQLAEVTLAAGRLSTTNVNEITDYINKEKSKQLQEQQQQQQQDHRQNRIDDMQTSYSPSADCGTTGLLYENVYSNMSPNRVNNTNVTTNSINVGPCIPTSSGGSVMNSNSKSCDDHHVGHDDGNNEPNNHKQRDTFIRRRNTVHEHWNRNVDSSSSGTLLKEGEMSSVPDQGDLHSVIKRNLSTPTMLNFNDSGYNANKTNFFSSSDDDSNYYSHKIFDRKKLRRSTISDNSKHDEHSCSSIPSSGDEHSMNNTFNKSHDQSSTSSEDDHLCPECGKKYSTSSNLARHRQTHRSILDKKARRCPHCDKVYVSMPAYSMHVRTHNQGCECPHCGKCFSRPWLLQGHIRTHTGEKPFKCNICSKAFADKSNLRAHVQTHSNTKPHACSRCGKAFALKSYLYKHEESSCMRNHLRSDKDRSKIQKTDSTRCTLVSKILRKEGPQNNRTPRTPTPIIPNSVTANDPKTIEEQPQMIVKADGNSDDDDSSQKLYTTLMTPTSQEDFDRFSRISVIRTPITTNQVSYEPANSLQLNYYQENPVDFSPKNGFTHSTKTSPFELTSSYAIVA